MNQKHNEGFTLVELIIAMLTGTLVFIAASTLLLLGLRINNQTTYTSQQMNNTNIVMSVLERMAAEGNITGVVPDSKDGDSWQIVNGEDIILSYSAEKQAIVFGAFDSSNENNPVLDNVYAAHAVMESDKVLTLAVETKEGTYQSSVYCRLVSLSADPTDVPVKVESETDHLEAREAFLNVLTSQYRLASGSVNTGMILQDKLSTGTYYSEWYIKTNGGSYGVNGWNKDTPWCACYISWALSQVDAKYFQEGAAIPKYANVDHFIAYFKKAESFKENPTAGDIIFFDWTGGDNPAHVGVVIKVDSSTVYTIEGNSAGIIALREYSINDNRIIGYGVLPWK